MRSVVNLPVAAPHSASRLLRASVSDGAGKASLSTTPPIRAEEEPARGAADGVVACRPPWRSCASASPLRLPGRALAQARVEMSKSERCRWLPQTDRQTDRQTDIVCLSVCSHTDVPQSSAPIGETDPRAGKTTTKHQQHDDSMNVSAPILRPRKQTNAYTAPRNSLARLTQDS